MFNYLGFILPIFILLLLSGCDIMSERIANIGRIPEMNKVNIYELDQDLVQAKAQLAVKHNSKGSGIFSYDDNLYKYQSSNKTASLWPGKNKQGFFSSRKIGDIISIIISIKDQAKLDNKTQKNNSSKKKVGITSLFGLEKLINKASTALEVGAGSESNGRGNIDRKEVVNTTVAATIIKILPSGNLLIKGKQEIRVNYEIREVTIEGIVRTADISSSNQVKLENIAEARVSYGGRGDISQLQKESYAKELIDIVSPF